MTAGGDAGSSAGWVPSEPPSPASPVRQPAPGSTASEPQLVPEPETQRLTRAALREAREAEVRRARWVRRSVRQPTSVLVAVPVAVCLAALIALSGRVSVAATALAVAVTALVTVWGWASLTDPPDPVPAGLVTGGGVVAICATTALTQTDPYLAWVPVAIAASFIAVFLQQLLRGDRRRLTEGIASAVAVLAVTASGAALIPLPHYPHGGSWILVSMVAVAAGSVPSALLRWNVGSVWVLFGSVVLGTAASAAAASLLGGIPLLGAVVLGLLASAISHAMLRVLLALPRAAVVQAALAVGSASVLVIGVVVYLLARMYPA